MTFKNQCSDDDVKYIFNKFDGLNILYKTMVKKIITVNYFL